MKNFKRLFLLFTMTCCFTNAFAQSTITGVILDAEDGSELPGVNVVIKGTDAGTVSDFTGSFQLNAEAGQTLIFSFIGYKPKEVLVGNQSHIEVKLGADLVQLDDVVVTAFGLKKEKKALAYAVSEVKGSDLTNQRSGSAATALSGRVAGLEVSGNAPGQATRVTIRGNTSISGNNQPLYVIDGVPMDNSIQGGADRWGGVDMGDGISGLNQDDIESMNVLKGPAATALYGSRGQNGVILITTKGGSSQKGIGVEFNANNTVNQAYGSYDSRQSLYGQGTRGVAPGNAADARSTGLSSWGPKMNGQQATHYDGSTYSMTDAYDPMDFYQMGYTLSNSVALSAGNETIQTRLSISDERIQGVNPSEMIKRNSINLRTSANLTDKFRVDSKLTYMNQQGQNRMKGSQDGGNARKTLGRIPASMPLDLLRQNASNGFFNNDIYSANPFWITENLENSDSRNRLLGYVSLSYDLTDWLTVTARSGGDGFVLQRRDLMPIGTPWAAIGELEEETSQVAELNHDLMFVYNYDINPDWNISGTFGGNLRQNSSRVDGIKAVQFNSPDFYHWTNAQSVETRQQMYYKETQSLFASTDIGYKNMLFMTITGRNDWSSTLPAHNNSYFYPSLSSSFVFSEAFDMPSWVSFGKVRGSWAKVGNDTDPYQLQLQYNMMGQGFPSFGRPPLGGIEGADMPNANLKSESTYSYEFGVDMKFLDNRLGFDVAYYNQLTVDQLMPVQISNTTGYERMWTNAGSVRNHGIELSVYATPIQTSDFSWDIGMNFNKNVNVVEELSEGIDQLIIGDFGNLQVQARPGEKYGAIVGYDYARDDNGAIMHNEDGLPMQATSSSVLGHVIPDWTAGLSNNFKYKNWNFGFLIDMKYGGSLYSSTNAMMYSAGTHSNTLEGREEYYNAGDQLRETMVDPEDYYKQIGSNIHSEFVYDASYVRMRELSFGYTFDNEMLGKTPFESVRLSFVMGNPFFIWRAAPNIDPTQLLNADNSGLGYEMGGAPSIRSYGFNLNFRL
ncbi:SusC/RagA family TonB-linked outer membrane protein [Persicobacter psychrovividus]|uniref:SusC/RagA family TonB-linked outer membrane protein n=1 Tax=Persicobacter psychrovividus TaxID=387638 RepID=A0ABN6LFF1_9BACT|nr:SusC/RagA family TonB-linked outer membrane protein [Persicobacter psychrovividus]